ncbi:MULTISPECIES: hypothetical protein [Methylobacterium]|jgi:hypothetical protein|uniref:Uncharacterized protein n=1 Tax=Methylobacterium hispanicum TaxID=270350 RepID=A0AAV4ZHY8_9HYPH|nr:MULTISPECIES: hypothetical protein [Methylobacterium]GJD88071.1 hypothetical protein BHAOGJBA_1582 [Methylobacterium hispanicum]
MPKPRDGRRSPDRRSCGSSAQDEGPLALAADRCIAAHEAVLELNDPDLHRLSEMLLLAVGKRLAHQDRNALRQLMN